MCIYTCVYIYIHIYIYIYHTNVYRNIEEKNSLTKNAEAGAGSEGAADRGRPAAGLGVPGHPSHLFAEQNIR